MLEVPVEREVLVMFRDGAVSLPNGRIEAALAEVAMPPTLRTVLQEARIESLRRGLPDFQKTDTLRVLDNGRLFRAPDYTNLFIVPVPAGESQESLITRLEALPLVAYAEPNQVGHPRVAPATLGPVDLNGGALDSPVIAALMPPERIPINEPRFGEQWGLRNVAMPNVDIEATQAWALTIGSSDNIVGVVDGLVYQHHQDLSGKVTIGLGAYGQHGTMVGGIIAAKGENAGGYVVGVDWLAHIHSERLGDLPTTAQSITNAVNAGARVINNSWGFAQQSTTLTQALRSAYEAGVLLVHANPYDVGGPDAQSDYPNNVGPWIVNVGAMTKTGSVCCDSGTRSYTDVAGPGEDILSTAASGVVAYGSGTSFSAPFVAGTASLLRAANPSLRTYDLEHVIIRTARNYGQPHDSETGYGMINAYEAIRHVSAPFVVQHGAASFPRTHTNVQRTFTASPGNGVAAGTYWVDVYKMEATPSYSFGQTPWGVWLAPTAKGLSGANPNNGQPYLYESIGATSATVNTFFYWVRKNSIGQTVNKWVPFDPTAFQCSAGAQCTGTYEYTVVGEPLPLSVSFSGPYSLASGQSGTWESTTTGGQAPYAYLWEYLFPCNDPDPCPPGYICELSMGPTCGQWSTGGTGSIFTDSFSGASAVQIRLTVTDGASATGQQTRTVSIGGSLREGDVADADGAEAANGAAPAASAGAAPVAFALEGAHPNPFTSATALRYALPEASAVRLAVYDALGREVALLADGPAEAGHHEAIFDGSSLPSGVYVVRLTAGGAAGVRVASARVTLMR